MNADAFLDALRDDPDDDTTRLVYADWLDEHGECERAGFIRLAVRLERLPGGHPGRPALATRYDDARLTHAAEWFGPTPASVEEVGLRGGTVTRLVFRPDATAAEFEAMLARHPATEVSITGERSVR